MQCFVMVELGMFDVNSVARYLVGMNDPSPKRTDKYRAYRARKKAAGLREIRMWVPDVHAPGFWEESVREAELLKNHASEEEMSRWIEALIAEDPGMFD